MMMIAKDKIMHFVGGAIVAVVTLLIVAAGRMFGLWLACLLAAVIVGIGWEYIQKFRNEGTFSWWDAAATIGGGIVVSAIVFALSI